MKQKSKKKKSVFIHILIPVVLLLVTAVFSNVGAVSSLKAMHDYSNQILKHSLTNVLQR